MKLIIEDEEGRRTTVPFVRDEVSVGRQEGNTARLADRNVSRRHALLLNQNGAIILEDLNSFNGVRLNGERINGRAAVHEGDLIQIGDYDLALARDEPEISNGRGTTRPDYLSQADLAKAQAKLAAAEAKPEASPAAASARTVIPAPSLPGDDFEVLRPKERPRLVLLNTSAVGREIVVDRAEVRIGHGDGELALDQAALGKEHVRLIRNRDGAWHVAAIGTAGGVKINGERHTEAPLAPGDVLQVGLVRMRFIAPGEPFSLAGFSEEQRRLERPVQFLLALVAVLLVAVLAYLWVMRPRIAPVPPEAAPNAQAGGPAPAGVPPANPVAPVVDAPTPPVAPPGAAAADSALHHGKGTKAGHRRRSGEDGEAGDETEAPQADAQSKSARLYEEGVALISDADYVAALAKLQKALDIDPSFAEAHKAMGVCYAHLQEAEKGAFHYEQYLKLNPGAEDAPEVRRMLADYYRTRGGGEPE